MFNIKQRTLMPTTPKASFLFLAGIMLIAANLRTAITSFPPLLANIAQDLSLAPAASGLLITLPLLLFALFSLFATKARNLGIEKSILAALTLIAAGTATRSWGTMPTLYIGTIILSIGIALGNVLMPILVKRDFPHNIALITTAYVTVMSIFASLASGLAVPIANLAEYLNIHGKFSGLNWQFSLIIWAVFAALAAIIWSPQVFKKQHLEIKEKTLDQQTKPIWKSRMAWEISMLMATSSIAAFTYFTWLPAILETHGLDQNTSGWILAYYQLTALVAGLTVPLAIAKIKDQKFIALFSGLLCAAGAGGLLLSPSLPWLWVGLTGFGNGIGFILALTFISLKTKNDVHAAKLSGMSQALGYLISAIGPVLFGLVYGYTGRFEETLAVLCFIGLAQAYFGLRSGRNATAD